MLRLLLDQTDLPVVETFQSAGAVSRELVDHFCGRVGLFRNQPGDTLLAEADVVIAVGYDPVEYDPELWNATRAPAIIHIDELPASLDAYYQPEIELIGGIAVTIEALTAHATSWRLSTSAWEAVTAVQAHLQEVPTVPASAAVVHPTHIIATLRELLPDDAIVACDIGSSYVWMARHFRTFEPRPAAVLERATDPGRRAAVGDRRGAGRAPSQGRVDFRRWWFRLLRLRARDRRAAPVGARPSRVVRRYVRHGRVAAADEIRTGVGYRAGTGRFRRLSRGASAPRACASRPPTSSGQHCSRRWRPQGRSSSASRSTTATTRELFSEVHDDVLD